MLAALETQSGSSLRSTHASTGTHSHVKVEKLIEGYSSRFTRKSRAHPSDLHTVVFAVKKLRMDDLRSILDDIANPFSANYGNYLSSKEVDDMTTNHEGSQRILHFLENHSLGEGRVEVLKTTPKKDYITARAPVRLWEAFFATEFHHFERKDGLRSGREEPLIRAMEYSLPIELSGDILGALNVADLPVVAQNFVRRRPPTAGDNAQASTISSSANGGTIISGSVTPALLNKFYNIGSNIGSSKVSQGVYESSSESFSPSDLTAFQKFMGIPTEAVAVDIGGHSANNACASAGGNNCMEGNLDVQYLMAVSQVTPTTYYYIDEKNFILDWLTQMASLANPPLVLSVSWGAEDSTISASYMTSMVNEAVILSSKGVTLVAASGDDGANDGATVKCGYTPSFPASCPYFTAVGATNVSL